MKRSLNISLYFLACWFVAQCVYAQAKPEFESSYNERFLKRSSLIGKDAPNVEVYDESGNRFRLSQSRGKHTVVVFGCLT